MECHVRLRFKLLAILGADVHTSFSAVARAEIDRLLVGKGGFAACFGRTHRLAEIIRWLWLSLGKFPKS